MTVSRNQFTLHDKTMLIGSSDSEPAGKLRVSLHHNVWKGIVQRAPWPASARSTSTTTTTTSRP